VEALRLLIANDDMRAHMGANGAFYVQRNYARDAVETAYQSLLDGPTRPTSRASG
jgi:hypothetical protein